MSDDEQHFLKRVRDTLDARSQQLSPALEGRLRAARRHALSPSRRAPSRRYWLPAMATAALVVIVVTMSWSPQQSEKSEISLAQSAMGKAAGDFDMLTQDAPLELYQDLEFYYWLEQEGTNAG